MDVKNLADLYGLPPIEWSQVLEALEGHNRPETRCFLATTRPDGRPHLTGVGAIWDDGNVYVVSGPGTRKSRNLAQNPNCSVSMALPAMDLAFEGIAERVTDDATLQRLAKRYGEGGWPARVEDGAFTYDYSAPSAGPPPWNVYRFTFHTAFGVSIAEPWGATRWRFDRSGT